MIEAVFDASTLLAMVLGERSVALDGLIHVSVMSSVNYAEVRTKLVDLGLQTLTPLQQKLLRLIQVVDFTRADAVVAAELRPTTKQAGLSLGDRACLALAIRMGVPVYTADRSWVTLDVGCKVFLIR